MAKNLLRRVCHHALRKIKDKNKQWPRNKNKSNSAVVEAESALTDLTSPALVVESSATSILNVNNQATASEDRVKKGRTRRITKTIPIVKVVPEKKEQFDRLVECIKSKQWGTFPEVLVHVLPADLLLAPDSLIRERYTQNGNILHLACKHGIPLQALNLLLEHSTKVTSTCGNSETGATALFSPLINVEDNDRCWMPLNYAMSPMQFSTGIGRAPEDVLLRLISEYKESVNNNNEMEDRFRWDNFLHNVVVGGSYYAGATPKKVVKALLEVDPRCALQCHREGNLMQDLWRSMCIDSIDGIFNETWTVIEEHLTSMPVKSGEKSHALQKLLSQPEYSRYNIKWEFMCCLVLSTCSGSPSTLVHSMVSLVIQDKLPLQVALLAITLQPHQLIHPNAEGNLPLHVILLSVTNTKSHLEELVSFLVAMEPSTARHLHGKTQQLPLHVAISAGVGWHNGLGGLVEAAPEVLMIKDPITGLLPAHLAASCEQSTVETIFRLLSCNPSQVLSVM